MKVKVSKSELGNFYAVADCVDRIREILKQEYSVICDGHARYAVFDMEEKLVHSLKGLILLGTEDLLDLKITKPADIQILVIF